MTAARLLRRGPGITLARAALLITAAVIAFTWPQARLLSTHVYSHVDPFFSMWRISWIAHALATEPAGLFDANIFHPATRTLAMSDATLLEGLVASPLLALGASPVLVYNLLLLGGMSASGVAMFVLARRLTGEASPALLAGLVYALAPFRFEHFMHLELQWAMWIPLTFWALHRAIEDGSWGSALLAGLFIWLQVISSVYYGVFLAMASAVLTAVLLASDVRRGLRALPRLVAGGLLAVVLTVPYAQPYRENASALGERTLSEVATYSARLSSYLAAPYTNAWWGWTAERWGGAELSLFPGLTVLFLAGAACWQPRRATLAYVIVALAAIELSLGTNGWIYPWLLDRIGLLQGLRAPSRFGIVALCALAALAALGAQAIHQRLAGALRPLAAAGLVALTLGEYRTSLLLAEVAPQPGDRRSVYAAMRALGRGAVLELPLASLDSLPGFEALYAYWSRAHWFPLVNGYSGYYPPEFEELVGRTAGFPHAEAIDLLRTRDVRYVVVHHSFFSGPQLTELLASMRAAPALEFIGRFEAPSGPADLFLILPSS